MWTSTNAKPENTYTSPARKSGALNERKNKNADTIQRHTPV